MINSETHQLAALIYEEYEIRDKVPGAVYPDEIAAAIIHRLDPKGNTQPLLSLAANLELRQLARQICAAHLADQEKQTEEQGDLFGPLQHRYPVLRNGKPGYARLDDLSLEEIQRNKDRLQKEIIAKTRHVKALEDYARKKFGPRMIDVG